MLEQLDSAELTEWAAYFELLDDMEDLRCGTVAAAVMNAARAKKRRGGTWRVVDFFPALRRWEVGAPSGQSLEAQVQAVQALAKRFGGRFTPGGAEA